MIGFSDRLHLLHNPWAYRGLFDLMMIMVAGLISKFGLSIPELMQDLALSASGAMKKSLQRTAGWELFFMMFLIKSAMVAYGAYWIADAASDWGWKHWHYSAQLYSWIEWIVYIGIAAALESPLFIAFSVLAQDVRKDQQEAVVAPESIG